MISYKSLIFLPVPILKDSQPNKLEELDDVEIIDDDFTTRRLSSAATCLVAGIEYTHGQQVKLSMYIKSTLSLSRQKTRFLLQNRSENARRDLKKNYSASSYCIVVKVGRKAYHMVVPDSLLAYKSNIQSNETEASMS
ncbi:hypothetical protein WA026_015493 [Henosepilachna vigintioctopunctata]|uniref:Uncharacterized protein n=1 Tax=Henosepilachna vigintioctopunctata TaxID=420089 RepID=A0AAW1UFS9_9CUCU